MIIYLVTFTVTAVFVQAAGSPRIRSGVLRVLVLSVPALIMSTVAGIRNYGVGGPDALVYGNDAFAGAVSANSFGSLVEYANRLSIRGEVGYLGLNYAVSRISSDAHVFYFWLALVNATIVLIAIMLMRDYAPPGLMWLTYLCTAYVDSFNLLRQGPALALALLGIVLVLRARAWTGLVVGLLGFLFHTSAIAFIPMWLVATYLARPTTKRGRRAILIIVVVVVGMFASSAILQAVGGSFAGGAYSDYLGGSARRGAAVGTEVLYRLIPILGGLYALKAMARRSEPTELLAERSDRDLPGHRIVESVLSATTRQKALLIVVVLLIIELIMLPIREISYPLYRIPAYFGYIRIVAYAMIASSLRTHKLPGYLAVVTFVAAYFYLVVYLRSQGEYSSSVLNGWLQL
ncbi:EpsG family protein [Plantibacter flavus]|uniref:EpsG family protein n=1 Tax=Plantibacter flavus TaxID=150123 RepID=UPI003F142A39